MKNEINDISKKKSFLWEFLKEYILHLIAALVLLYFTVAGIIGNFLSKEDNMAERVFEGVMIGFLVALGIIIALGIVTLIYCKIKTNINKINAIKRYTYLPLTANELRLKIDKGDIFKDPADYIKYICEQMRYYSESTNEYKSLKLTIDDLLALCKTYEEIYKQPIVLNYDYYLYCKKHDYTNPFIFVAKNHNIDNIIWDVNEENKIAILCTDKSKAEDYIKGCENIKTYTIYDVGNVKKEQ